MMTVNIRRPSATWPDWLALAEDVSLSDGRVYITGSAPATCVPTSVDDVHTDRQLGWRTHQSDSASVGNDTWVELVDVSSQVTTETTQRHVSLSHRQLHSTLYTHTHTHTHRHTQRWTDTWSRQTDRQTDRQRGMIRRASCKLLQSYSLMDGVLIKQHQQTLTLTLTTTLR